MARVTTASIANEQRLTDWLTKRMQDQPYLPLTKSAARQPAAKGGLRCSGRSFDRAWADAVKASGASKWSNPVNAEPPRSFAAHNRRGCDKSVSRSGEGIQHDLG
jgi:hypothetical protein